MSKSIDVIREEVSTLEFCEALDITTSDLIEAFMDKLLDARDDPLDLFYWLDNKYRGEFQ